MKIFIEMNSNTNFLIETSKKLELGLADDSDMKLFYDFVITLDNDVLIMYFSMSSVFSYKTDLDVYIDIVDKLRIYFEKEEQYEKCGILKNIIIKSNKLKTNKIL